MKKFTMEIPDHIISVMARLKKKGFESYVVGGAVRNSLLGKPVKDYDLSTNATVKYMVEEVFDKGWKMINPNGAKHGTITLRFHHDNIEVTEFKHLEGLAPSLEEDLIHRDFTMNSLYYNPEKGLIDPSMGRRDITLKRIRCYRDPDLVFNEDPLRMLRALRFKAEMGFSITEKVRKSIHKNKELIKRCSKERIKAELDRIMVSPLVKEIFIEYKDLFEIIIPEIREMDGYDQKNHHHPHDLLTHTLNVVSNTRGEKILRYSALFHDIGKPSTMIEKMNDDGTIERHFYGHPFISAEITEKILRNLTFSNQEISDILLVIKWHDYEIALNRKSIKKFLSKFDNRYSQAYLTLELMKSDKSDTICHDEFKYDEIKSMLDEIINENSCMSLSELDIKGNDLMDNFGIYGKMIRVVLLRLLKLVIEDDYPNEREKLLDAVRNNDIQLTGDYLEILERNLTKQGDKNTDGQ